MTKKIIFLVIVFIGLTLILKMQVNNNKEDKINMESEISIDPISHASIILTWDGMSIYVDPVDENKKNVFAGKDEPDLILITDIHGDHFDVETLKAITKNHTTIIAPKAVADMMPEELEAKVAIMNNGDVIPYIGSIQRELPDNTIESTFDGGPKIEAIPMYNLPGPNEKYHTKGRGNGYVIERNGKRVYISGDTAGIPEMRALQNIDIAFVAMNLPYTMDPEEAASAVLEFKPKKVYPYHYRQNPTNDFADVAKFKEIVNSKNSQIEVVQLEWYPKS
jgi:L-ascorbate metabolism protein UlaG (beta-lactamase superfamily)